MPQSVIVFGRC